MFLAAAFLIIAGVALFVAAPLTGGLARRRAATREAQELAHWEHEQALAVQGLRELEFDREMSKLADADYTSLKAALQARALQAMSAIERNRDAQRAANLAAVEAKSKPRLVSRAEPSDAAPAPSAPAAEASAPPAASPRPIASDTVSSRRPRFCPQCGTRAPASGNFCGDCGASLRGERVAARAS